MAASFVGMKTLLCRPGLCLTSGLTGAVRTVRWTDIEWTTHQVAESHGVVIHTLRLTRGDGRSEKIQIVGGSGEKVAGLVHGTPSSSR
jgi:hypothetical protein